MAKVFGGQALVQRCTMHKRRNVGDHLREGLDNRFTIRCLGVGDRLVRSLLNTNMISR